MEPIDLGKSSLEVERRQDVGIKIGMTSDEVLSQERWKYNRIKVHTTVTANIRHEQWVYGSTDYMDTLLYFDNGVLIAIQH
jgi:hypothetical protein